jgi:hypothetical protein
MVRHCLPDRDMLIKFLLASASTLLLIAPAFGGEKPNSARTEPSGIVTKEYQSNGWLVQESDTFRVYCLPNLAEAKRLPQACESLRRQLQETWFADAAKAWTPRCDIVVHPSVAGYVRELGAGSRNSSGCATVDVEKGQVVKRRIDLRADADDWLISALPHELTHVVLAEKFADKQIPRWADEGMAILTEPVARQAIRRAAMQRAVTRTPQYGAAELLAIRDYPQGDRRDAFYGQSASLVAYLIERDSPARFLDFLQVGQKQGFERALMDVYGIRSLAELDARWRPQILDRGQSAELFASRIARITGGKQID